MTQPADNEDAQPSPNNIHVSKRYLVCNKKKLPSPKPSRSIERLKLIFRQHKRGGAGSTPEAPLEIDDSAQLEDVFPKLGTYVHNMKSWEEISKNLSQ